jgi:hypothetical protein
MLYYQLLPLSDGGKADRHWAETNIKRFPCGHRDVFEKFYPSITIDAENFETKYAISFVGAPLTVLLRSDVIEIIMPEITNLENVKLGRLISNKTGDTIHHWKTLWMPTTRIRGDHRAKYWRCATCRNVIYHSPPSCQYFSEVEAAGKPLCLCNGCLVLREDVYQRLIASPNWGSIKKKVRINKVEVLKKMLDGYPDFLSKFDPEIRYP